MKRSMKSVLVCLFCVMGSLVSFSQDIHFSQFDMAPLQQNPALAGALYGVQATINYKDQWRTIGAPYKTFAMGYDMRLDKKNNTENNWCAV